MWMNRVGTVKMGVGREEVGEGEGEGGVEGRREEGDDWRTSGSRLKIKKSDEVGRGA